MNWSKRLSFLSILLTAFFTKTNCDDGLCGIEPPKAGESCSGKVEENDVNKTEPITYDYVEKELSEKEKEMWAKRYYAKRSYTNNKDWPLHEQLDLAEEHVNSDIDKAIEMFDAIVEKNPNSPRAVYVRARIMENRLVLSNLTRKSQEYQDQLNSIFDVYMSLMDRYEDVGGSVEDYDIMPIMFSSLVQHSTGAADRHNKTQKSIEFLTKAMEKFSSYNLQEKYHLIIVQNHLGIGDFDGAGKAIEKAMEIHKKSILLKFYKGIVLKSTGKKKEGNRLLRSIDSEGLDTNRLSHEMNLSGSMLYNNGLYTLARLVFQEASKLHIFKSKFQRPVITISREIETKPVWDVEAVELSSFFRYRLYYKFQQLLDFVPTLKEEVMEAITGNNEDWYVFKEQEIAMGNRVRGSGNYSTLPTHTYGKRKRVICSEVMPKTCKFLKEKFERVISFKHGVTKVTTIDAHTKTLPLDGMTNMKLKVLVPIQIPEGFKIVVADTEVTMEIGKITVIDESFEHSYDNEKGNEKAIWLSFDIPHPDCTKEELKRVSVTAYAQQLFLTV